MRILKMCLSGIFLLLILRIFVCPAVRERAIDKFNEKDFETPVRIVMIADNEYVRPTQAVIRSINANKNPDTQIEVYVVGVDLMPINAERLKKEKQKNLKVKVFKFNSDILHYLPSNDKVEKTAVSIADNTKFLLPEILSDFDKIIYLDGDVIVQKDLSDFYNTDLGTNYIGAVDDWQSDWGNNSKDRYFNNGVILLNLKQMRKDNVSDKLIEAKKNDQKHRFVTQDAYNTVMKNRVVYLPLTYNTFAPEYESDNVLKRVKEVLKKNYNPETYKYKNSDEFRNDVAIIHYCGFKNLKPWWKVDFDRPTNNIWYDYAPVDFWISCMLGQCFVPFDTEDKTEDTKSN